MNERKAKQERREAKRRRDLPLADLVGIVERTKPALTEGDYDTLKSAIETLAFLTQELAARGTTIDRLRRMLFGASTEKTSQVVGEPATDGKDGAAVTGVAGPVNPPEFEQVADGAGDRGG